MIQHKLIINDLPLTYLSPFRSAKILSIVHDFMGCNYSEGESKVTINGTQSFIVNKDTDLGRFERLLESAVIASSTENLFKED